jgi:dihydrofolate reductase
MRKVIAGINITIDAFCNHDAAIADGELHQHYNQLLKDADTMIWGRVVYRMMESYWPTLVDNPSGDAQSDEFAVLADNIHKIVYSRTLKEVTWKNSELKSELNKEDIIALKQQPGKNILVGSPSMIVAFTQLGLIDEYQFCIHPIILGEGLPLFKHIKERIDLKLLDTKIFASGAVVMYYEPANHKR